MHSHSFLSKVRPDIVGLCFALLIGWATPYAVALEAEHEAERLLIATEEAFAAGQHQQAESYLNQVRRLGIIPPADYNFFYGKLLAHNKRNVEARNYLENYVNYSGAEGTHYREALSLITEIQKQRGNRTSSNTRSGKVEINWSDNSRKYVGYLQELYSADDATIALTRHINSLLKFYAYGDERVIAASRMGTPTRHRIHTSDSGDLVSMNKAGLNVDTPYQEDRFSVYGVNPFVRYQCVHASASCWILHPVTKEKWLQVVNSEEAVGELTKAISQLIRQMQRVS